MQRTWKTVMAGVALTTALSASATLAQDPTKTSLNVANTTQKGSIMVFPQIDVRQSDSENLHYRTVVRISNDGALGISVKCYYMNQTKGRNDVQFRLTAKQSAQWDARTGFGDPFRVNAFPVDADDGLGGSTEIGELICFAVNMPGEAQVAWNHLSGTATVYDDVAGSAYEYNSWNFKALGAANNNNRAFGAVQGILDLTGTEPGTYDACPTYNIAHFSPTNTNDSGNSTRVAVSSCWQDLRQAYTPHYTKLLFTVWNAQETRYTGAHHCVNSTASFYLSEIQTQALNTSYERLGTETAHMWIRGIEDDQVCAPFDTENSGLLAVVTSYSGNSATAVTTNSATGAVPGRIQWDVSDGTLRPE